MSWYLQGHKKEEKLSLWQEGTKIPSRLGGEADAGNTNKYYSKKSLSKKRPGSSKLCGQYFYISHIFFSFMMCQIQILTQRAGGNVIKKSTDTWCALS